MTRKFWTQARGQAAQIFKYIIPDTLSTYEVIEFGADDIAYSGNRRPNRWYGVVLALVGGTQLCVCPCENAAAAFMTANELRATILAKAPTNPVEEPAPESAPAPAPAAEPEPAE